MPKIPEAHYCTGFGVDGWPPTNQSANFAELSCVHTARCWHANTRMHVIYTDANAALEGAWGTISAESASKALRQSFSDRK
jgi:hypothetical protein